MCIHGTHSGEKSAEGAAKLFRILGLKGMTQVQHQLLIKLNFFSGFVVEIVLVEEVALLDLVGVEGEEVAVSEIWED